MKKSNFLKGLLVVQTLSVSMYTVIVFKQEGANLFAVFISNLQALNWSGQFNLDFSCYLLLSGLWIMWRNKFSRNAILLGSASSVVGIVFFAPYLIWLLIKHSGELKAVLLGRHMNSKATEDISNTR